MSDEVEIHFEDNSFVKVEEAISPDKLVSITMCGINPQTKRLIMTASDLDAEQLEKLIDFLQLIAKKY